MQNIVDAFSDASISSAYRLTRRRPRCCTNPTLQEPERGISWLIETSRTLFWNSPTSEALYHVMDALTMKYRGGWPRLVHLSADYARDSGTTTMCPCRLKARYTVQSCCPPSSTEPRPGQCRRQVKKLHAFMMRHLHSIMRITWIDKVTNKEILKRTGLSSMEVLLIRKNLRWTGHLMRMSSDRLPKQVLYSQLSSGHRKRGRPRLRFKDTIKRNLKLRDIKIDSGTSLSQQRDKWRATVK